MVTTPCSFSHSTPPGNVRDSPITTVGMLNCRISPLQYQHGANVVTMIVSAYPGRRSGLDPEKTHTRRSGMEAVL